MSGSGGFYKYRCRYFLSHNCPNWVWVHNAPCAACLAEGRDAEATPSTQQAWRFTREICVPQILDGTLQYTLMEIVADQSGTYWTLRHKVARQPVYSVKTTSDTPNPVVATAGPSGQMAY